MKNHSLSTTEFFTIMVIITILAALLVPQVQQAGSNPRRQYFKNQMKAIGLALHEYQNEHGCLPPAVVRDEQGNPLHSWRAILLPYLKTKRPFEQYQLDYRFDEPWSSPHNQRVADKNPKLFRGDWKISKNNSPTEERRNSKLVAVIDNSSYWPENQTRQIGKNRIVLIEVPELPGLWNEPTDISLDELINLTRTDRFAPHGAFALYDDGRVRWLTTGVFNPGYMDHLLQAP
ncbi:DUF1559 family PulG-like putative transporter [Gimesia fumaroli]|nr:DUF1559 domain-containing protein [Gimesia fumaroli]